MPPHSSREARRAAIAGTRALIHEATFDALVSLLVRSGAVPAASARQMMMDLADRLTGYANGAETEWQVHQHELTHQAFRLVTKAAEIGRAS